MLCSCYKDLSTEATQIIPDIVVTGLPERLDVVYGEEIHLAVNAYMGEKGNADLKFLWEIDITAGSSKARAELGEARRKELRLWHSCLYRNNLWVWRQCSANHQGALFPGQRRRISRTDQLHTPDYGHPVRSL